MMNEREFRVPEGLSDGLRMTAICNTTHKALAAIALLRAAADILCDDLGPEKTSQVIVDVVTQAAALHAGAQPVVGHA